MRKVNFAAIVNEKTPRFDAEIWLFCANYCNNNGLLIREFAGRRPQFAA